MKVIEQIHRSQAVIQSAQQKILNLLRKAKEEAVVERKKLFSSKIMGLMKSKQTLQRASNLQREYKRLGAPSTQNVRGPFPIARILTDSLPRLHNDHDEIQFGALPFTEIMEAFEECELPSRNPTTVRQCLRHLVAAGMIEHDKMEGQKGSGKAKYIYFMRQ